MKVAEIEIAARAEVTARDIAEARAHDGRTVNERWFVGTVVAFAWIASLGWALRRFAIAAVDQPTGALAYLIDAESGNLRPAGWLVTALALAFVVALGWWLWSRIVRRLRGDPEFVARWAPGPTVYRFTRERGIDVENASGCWTVPWDRLDRCGETPELILLRWVNASQLFVPKRAFGDRIDEAKAMIARCMALPDTLPVFVCRHVLSGAPVRLVEFGRDDIEFLDWQFLCGEDGHNAEDAAIVDLGEVLARDKSLREPVDALYPDGGAAERDGVGMPWRYADSPASSMLH